LSKTYTDTHANIFQVVVLKTYTHKNIQTCTNTSIDTLDTHIKKLHPPGVACEKLALPARGAFSRRLMSLSTYRVRGTRRLTWCTRPSAKNHICSVCVCVNLCWCISVCVCVCVCLCVCVCVCVCEYECLYPACIYVTVLHAFCVLDVHECSGK